MFINIVPTDSVLNQGRFLKDEIQYNLLHRICESQPSVCLKSSDETMILAQSHGHNAWLWMAADLAVDQRTALLQELAVLLKGLRLPGVSGDPVFVEMFAKLYAQSVHAQYHTYMTLMSYACPQVKKAEARGSIRRANRQDSETVAEFMAGFSKDAYGNTVAAVSQLSAASGLINAGHLYLWMADGIPVSMANIAQRTQRHARINAVYTPSAYRNRGYASAIVSELCSMLERERLTPMLYADLQNPSSNKVYQKLGFLESGKIAELKFTY